jgi:hypothetical protein
MNPQLYQVTLTDLGTYTVTVPGHSPEDACKIAKGIFAEEAGAFPPGVKATAREVSATAEPVPPPTRLYDVHATYSLDFSIRIPAANRAEAELNAKRLYSSQPFPWEHDHNEDRVRWSHVTEVEQ